MTGHKQTTDGTAYATGYTYNLSGALVEQTYPSGRVVRNTLDADGDLASIVSSPRVSTGSSAGPRTYANTFNYTAA